MPIERPIFSSEPIRKVKVVPLPAAELYHERNGQQYFWENVTEFSDSWTTLNKQLPFIVLKDRPYLTDLRPDVSNKQLKMNFNPPPLRWPEEDINDGRGYSYPNPHDIPIKYVEKNQEFWRKQKRGKISRVIEFKHSGELLHRNILRTFNFKDVEDSQDDSIIEPSSNSSVKYKEPKYVDRPILVWSVFFDRPEHASSQFVYEERSPEHIPEQHRKAWLTGMERITEYATNYAASDFFKQQMNRPVLRSIAEVYTKFADFASYRILIGGTYRRMGAVEDQAVINGKDYKKALFKGLFEHDYGEINELIADTKHYSGLTDIDDMAMEIGYNKFNKPDLGKLLGKLELNQNNNWLVKRLKNLSLSCLAGGVYRNPGVTEISGGGIALLTLEPLIVNLGYLIANPDLMQAFAKPDAAWQIVSTLALLTASAITPYAIIKPYVAAHENLHNYSANKDYMGYIPAKIIKKETVPGFTALEPNPNLND